MIEWSQLESQINEIKQKIKKVYDNMMDCNNPTLPKKPKEIINLEQTLNDEDLFDVVVCGEVKKGKSSFINAVVGEPILPVDTQVATCQVFRIINSDEESYSLVFIDGSKQPIQKEELQQFGSQAAIDEETLMPKFEKAIDHIEVCHPIAFLPKQVALVDTPGLGSVYAAHEQITQHYLKRASAVIFIVDPSNPITQTELKAIKQALDITPNIMFVMTKMDNYSEQDLQRMLDRDQEILLELEPQVSNQKITLLPMSSKLLVKAAEQDAMIYRMASRFDDVKDGMLAMVYQSIGLGRNIERFNILAQYDAAVKRSIQELESALQNNTLDDLIAQKNRLLQDFTTMWGSNGSQRTSLTQVIRDQISALQNNITLLLAQGGPIYNDYINEIEAHDLNADTDILKCYTKGLPERLKSDIEIRCNNTVSACIDNITTILKQYKTDISQWVMRQAKIHGIEELPINMDFPQSFSEVWNNFRQTWFSTYIIITIATLICGGWIAGLIVFLSTVIVNTLCNRNQKNRKMENKCKDILSKALNESRNHILIEANPKTQVKKIQDELATCSQKAITNIYNEQESIIKQQIAVIQDQINSQAAERQQNIEALQQTRSKWLPISNQLVDLKKQLESVKQEIEQA